MREPLRAWRLAVVERVSPLEGSEFVWPSEADIKDLQRYNRDDQPADVQWDEDRQLVTRPDGQVWVPDAAVEVQQWLCVVAHAGAGGHRGAAATSAALVSLFYWKTLVADVCTFVGDVCTA